MLLKREILTGATSSIPKDSFLTVGAGFAANYNSKGVHGRVAIRTAQRASPRLKGGPKFRQAKDIRQLWGDKATPFPALRVKVGRRCAQ